MIKSNGYTLINLTGSDIDYQDSIVIKADGIIRFETRYIPNDKIKLNNNVLNLFRKEINHIDITLNHDINFTEYETVLIIISPTEADKFNIMSNDKKLKTLKYISEQLDIPYYDQMDIISPFNIVPRIIESFKCSSRSVIYCDSFEIIYSHYNKKFIIKETDKSEVLIDNSNNLFVIVSETGPEQPSQLNKTKNK